MKIGGVRFLEAKPFRSRIWPTVGAIGAISVALTSCGDNSFKGSALKSGQEGSSSQSSSSDDIKDAGATATSGGGFDSASAGGSGYPGSSVAGGGAGDGSGVGPSDGNLGSGDGGSGAVDSGAGVSPPKSPAEAFQESCASGNVKSDSVVVTIPKNDGYICKWGQDGNGAKESGALAARLERQFPVTIPQGRTVCSMKARSEEQTIRYDDHFFLTLNQNLLVSNNAEISRFTMASNGFPQYAWEKIKGASTSEKLFCADGVTCQLPKTQEFGAFSFDLSDEANKRLFSSLLGQSLNFQLIITGDNDSDSDCQLNSDLKLTVTYTYSD